jgi:hypothetical protein
VLKDRPNWPYLDVDSPPEEIDAKGDAASALGTIAPPPALSATEMAGF